MFSLKIVGLKNDSCQDLGVGVLINRFSQFAFWKFDFFINIRGINTHSSITSQTAFVRIFGSFAAFDMKIDFAFVCF